MNYRGLWLTIVGVVVAITALTTWVSVILPRKTTVSLAECLPHTKETCFSVVRGEEASLSFRFSQKGVKPIPDWELFEAKEVVAQIEGPEGFSVETAVELGPVVVLPSQEGGNYKVHTRFATVRFRLPPEAPSRFPIYARFKLPDGRPIGDGTVVVVLERVGRGE